LGFKVKVLGFWVSGFGVRVKRLGFGVRDSVQEVYVSTFRPTGGRWFRSRVWGFGVALQDLGFPVSDLRPTGRRCSGSWVFDFGVYGPRVQSLSRCTPNPNGVRDSDRWWYVCKSPPHLIKCRST
jgi:hypothetical protein